jgi:hypothetical protein
MGGAEFETINVEDPNRGHRGNESNSTLANPVQVISRCLTQPQKGKGGVVSDSARTRMLLLPSLEHGPSSTGKAVRTR